MKSDVIIANNYLDEKYLKAINRLVSAYLDLVENVQAGNPYYYEGMEQNT